MYGFNVCGELPDVISRALRNNITHFCTWQIRTLYTTLERLEAQSVHYMRHIRDVTFWGFREWILDDFGVPGVDLEEPGNDFLGIFGGRELSELLEFSKFLDFFRTFRTYKTSRTFRTLRIFRTFKNFKNLGTSRNFRTFRTFQNFQCFQNNFWMWQLLDVTTPGCDYSWM